MPRIENIGPNVDAWYTAQTKTVGNGSSTWDVCRRCYDTLLADPHAFDAELDPYNGDPPGDLGRGGDIDHPSYAEEHYQCAVCGRALDEYDDSINSLT